MSDLPIDRENTVDLHPLSGVEVSLHSDALPELAFGANVIAPVGEVRTAAELAPVLRTPDAVSPETAIYTIYRGIAPQETASEIQQRGLLYVVLLLHPGTLGEEWVRTRGHTNPGARSTNVAYPEVHEVWHGDALLYLQKETFKDVTDTVVIPLRPGDKAVIAPGWASLLANVGSEPLVVGSWRTSDCVAQTDALNALGGMAHYILKGSGPGEYTFDANPKYHSAPLPRTLPPQDLPDFGLKSGEPMLTTFRANPDFLRFLTRPQDYTDVWARVYGDGA